MPDSSSSIDLSDDESIDLENDEGASDWEEEEEITAVCLFCETAFTAVDEALQHQQHQHQFDLQQTRERLQLDLYGSIKLINYIRSETKAGRVPQLNETSQFNRDEYLRPVIPDDALLFSLEDPDMDEPMGGLPAINNEARVFELEEQVKTLEARLATLQPAGASSAAPPPDSTQANGEVIPGEERDNDSYYFQSYAWNEIHETMLKDAIRTDAYRDFIYKNKAVFKNKVVLDVGCGTGILSLFCAKAGAKQVIAVDNSDIIDKARAIVFENSQDHIITCLRGKIEEVELPVDKVDIIVSEWMGYGLLYEAMLDSVLYARDKFLRPGGLMVPSECRLLIAAVYDPDYIYDRVHFWDSIYGFRMQTMKQGIYDDAVVECLYEQSMCSAPYIFKVLNLHTMTSADADFSAPFRLQTMHRGTLDAFLIYFDTFFMTGPDVVVPRDMRAEHYRGQGVAFTTGPFWTETHWKQSILLISGEPEPFEADVPIHGQVQFRKRTDNPRELEIGVHWSLEHVNPHEKAPEKREQSFFMR